MKTKELLSIGCTILLVCLVSPSFSGKEVRNVDEFFSLMAWDYVDDKETLQKMHDCAINMVCFVPPKMLDACEELGIKAIVFNDSVSGDDWRRFDLERAMENLPQLIKKVNQSPAVLGYHLRDEPVAAEFEGLARASALVRKLAPGKFPYINLFPGEGDSYDEYLERFITTCKPPILSYDRYVLGEDGGFSPVFWTNIAQVRQAALKHGIPFWNIVLTASHWGYREVTATDIRMQAYGTLVYGGRGISYYKFNSRSLPILNAPDLGNFRMGPLDQFGYKTVTYDWLRTTNLQILNLAPTLMKLSSDDVYHFGEVPDRNHAPTEKNLVKNMSAPPGWITHGEFVVGDFTHEDGSRYVLIVNKSMKSSSNCLPEFNVPVKSLRYVDPATGKLRDYPIGLYALAPGQGVLVKLD